MTQGCFADNVDQDQTAQNVQSDLESTLSDKEIFSTRKITFEIPILSVYFLILAGTFHRIYSVGQE